MGLVREFLGSITRTLSEVDGDGEGGGTGGDVNGSSAGKIETTLDERPTVGIPRHAGKWIVDERRPDEDEYKGGAQTTTFGHSTNSENWTMKEPSKAAIWIGFLEDLRDGGEHALVDAKDQCRDTRGTHRRLGSHALEAEVS